MGSFDSGLSETAATESDIYSSRAERCEECEFENRIRVSISLNLVPWKSHS